MKKIISLLFLTAATISGFTQNFLIINKDLYQNGGEEYVLITPEGKVLKTFKDIGIKTGIYEDMIAAVDKKTKKLGYLSAKTGEWAIKPQFENTFSVYPFKEGIAIICIDEGSGLKKTIIDKSGKMLLPFTSWDIDNFSEGLAIVRQTIDGIESSGAIDKTGKLVIPFSKGHIERFKEGLAVKIDEKNMAGFIDKKGNWAIKPQWETAFGFSEGLSVVSLKTKNAVYGFIDKTGKLVIKYQFDVADSFMEGAATVGILSDKGGDAVTKYTYIDKTGRRLTTALYDIAMSFSDGLAAVSIEKDDDLKYGFIDKKGQLVIPMMHEKASGYFPKIGFKEGLCPTLKGYIDKKGNLLFDFSKKGFLAETDLFENGLASFSLLEPEGKYLQYMVIDKTSKIVWQSGLNKAGCFPAGSYVTMADGNRKKIEDIKSGDVVLDLNNTPLPPYTPSRRSVAIVEAVQVHEGNFNIKKVYFNMPNGVDFASNLHLKNTVSLSATLNHPLYINGEKKPFNDIKIGDEILQIVNNKIVKVKVAFVENELKTVSKVYNLKTNGKGYFVNGYGVLVK